MKTFLRQTGFLVVGIFLAGFILDEVGNKKRLGNLAQSVAKKITRGYGV